MLYKVVLTFDSLDEILKCHHSNESYWAVLSCSAFLCCTTWNRDLKVSISDCWFTATYAHNMTALACIGGGIFARKRSLSGGTPPLTVATYAAPGNSASKLLTFARGRCCPQRELWPFARIYRSTQRTKSFPNPMRFCFPNRVTCNAPPTPDLDSNNIFLTSGSVNKI